MRPHDVARLDRIHAKCWGIRCTCGEPIVADGPIEAHRAHQDHVVAVHLAEQTGVERVAKS